MNCKNLLVLVWFLGTQFVFAQGKPLSHSDTIRVLTFNIFAGKTEMDFERLQRQIEAVSKLNPDIIALQEVFDERVKEKYRNAFKEFDTFSSGVHEQKTPLTLPQKLISLTRKALETANRFLKIVPWIKGTGAILDGDSHGLMLLLNKRKGFSDPQTKLVEIFKDQVAVGVKPKLLESVKPKGYIWIEYEISGIKLLVVNTHLSLGVFNERRQGQLNQIIEKILERDIQSQCPVIFCGDTNADAERPEMKWLHSTAGFLDTYVFANPNIQESPHQGMTWDNKNPLTLNGHLQEPDQRIDFVSVKGSGVYQFEVLSSQIVLDSPEDKLSDHYGVLTELRVIPHCEEALVKK